MSMREAWSLYFGMQRFMRMLWHDSRRAMQSALSYRDRSGQLFKALQGAARRLAQK